MAQDLGLREAVTQSLRMGGTQLLSQPNRFRSFLTDLMDSYSLEGKVISFQINDELLAPLEKAAQAQTRESLERARAIVRSMLYRERGIDAKLSGIVADGLVGGLADFLGVGISPWENGSEDSVTGDDTVAHAADSAHEDETPQTPQFVPAPVVDRSTRVVSPPPKVERPLYETAPNASVAATTTTPTKKRGFGLVIALVSLAVLAIAVVAIVVTSQHPTPSYKSDGVTAVQVSENAPEEKTTEETTDYGKGYVFTQLVDPSYEPYEYYDANKELTGFDVELARAVCDYYGWEYAASSIAFDTVLPKLGQGEGSCAWSGITRTPEREEIVLFSKPYVEDHDVFEGEEIASKYAVAFRKEDTKLCELVNAAFDALSADGTVQKIANKYLDSNDVLLL